MKFEKNRLIRVALILALLFVFTGHGAAFLDTFNSCDLSGYTLVGSAWTCQNNAPTADGSNYIQTVNGGTKLNHTQTSSTNHWEANMYINGGTNGNMIGFFFEANDSTTLPAWNCLAGTEKNELGICLLNSGGGLYFRSSGFTMDDYSATVVVNKWYKVVIDDFGTTIRARIYNETGGLVKDQTGAKTLNVNPITKFILYAESSGGTNGRFDNVLSGAAATGSNVYFSADYAGTIPLSVGTLETSYYIQSTISSFDAVYNIYSLEIKNPAGTTVAMLSQTQASQKFNFLTDSTDAEGTWTVNLLQSQAYPCCATTTIGSTTIQLFKRGYANSSINVTGNLTLDKSIYNRTDLVDWHYNISSAGRLMIQPLSGGSSYIYSISQGNNTEWKWYVPSDAPLGGYFVFLQYFDGLTWNTLDGKTFTISYSGTNTIEFSDTSKIYFQNSGATINAIGTDDGYVKILDAKGNIKLNQTITANTFTTYTYFITLSDPTGPWGAYLYNSTGTVVAADYADVYTPSGGQSNNGGGIIVPTYLPVTPVAGGGNGSVDFVGDPAARKSQENNILNFFYGTILTTLMLATFATWQFFMKKM